MSETQSKSSAKAKIQKFGTFLSGMIMPNIGAIIAWGFMTAIFMSPNGWFPNKYINSFTSSMLYFMIPILIAYTGGKSVYEERGGVVGAISVVGTIVLAFPWANPVAQGIVYPALYPYAANKATGIPMFLGAMIMGPLSAWCLKKFDQAFQSKVKAGFEMIYNNFSQGIMGMIFVAISYFLIGPILVVSTIWIANGVDWIIAHHLLPLANLVIEPAKVLFLNNAIGNGVLVPLGIQQAAMAGGITGTFLFSILGGGLTAAASPGSIIAILLVSAKDAYFGNIVGVLGSAIVSFVVAAVIYKMDKSDYGDLAAAQGQMAAMKAESKGLTEEEAGASAVETVESYKDVQRIIFACDAGMGSSAMGASLLRDKVRKAGLNLPVTNTAVRNLKDEPGLLVITQEELAERAKEKTPNALHVAVGNFLSTPKYDQVVARLKAAGETLPEADQVKKSEKTAAKANSLASIDFSKVKEVNFIRHDQHLGTVTMASSLFKDQMKKAGKTTPVKAVRINELDNDPSHLVIVTPMAGKNLAIRYDQIQVITVADLLKAGEVSGLVDKLK
ncbi:PTS transporter subunit EIIC [Lactobacillus delbrueckii subsp. lactis]|uniref:PTS transporter subunit EIIC n=1 Tax=Lactobacillus delbrueckii TaxID=1584 RepID=UPI001E5E7C4B|nr:PTS transporter subunit EIIC [Lactobacillus delbrueckii]MCD5578977.1 PTS transporter subunit EIIC [Lactobacillus delbrueckii subsp. lactis]